MVTKQDFIDAGIFRNQNYASIVIRHYGILPTEDAVDTITIGDPKFISDYALRRANRLHKGLIAMASFVRPDGYVQKIDPKTVVRFMVSIDPLVPRVDLKHIYRILRSEKENILKPPNNDLEKVLPHILEQWGRIYSKLSIIHEEYAFFWYHCALWTHGLTVFVPRPDYISTTQAQFNDYVNEIKSESSSSPSSG